MSKFHQQLLVIDDQLTIKCCKCYELYWKGIKSSPSNDYKFDESIEKNKSVRKFFIRENVLFHYCFPGLKEVLIKKKIVVINDLTWFLIKDVSESHVAAGSCITDVLNEKKDIESICFGCVNFMLLRLDCHDFVIV